MTAPTEPARTARRPPALDAGRLLAGLGALALLISLFLDWYGSPASAAGGFGAEDSPGITAWTAFELIDILLLALALATLAWAIEGSIRPSRPRIPSMLGTLAGPVALAIVLISIINEPPLLATFDPEREAGVWVALAGAAVMTIGALLGYARISVVVSPRERASAESAAGARPTAGDPDRETETYRESAPGPLADEPWRRPR